MIKKNFHIIPNTDFFFSIILKRNVLPWSSHMEGRERCERLRSPRNILKSGVITRLRIWDKTIFSHKHPHFHPLAYSSMLLLFPSRISKLISNYCLEEISFCLLFFFFLLLFLCCSLWDHSLSIVGSFVHGAHLSNFNCKVPQGVVE